MDVPHFGGDQLLVFQCPRDSDCSYTEKRNLPANFWDAGVAGKPPFWRILVQSKGVAQQDPDPIFRPTRLSLRETEDKSDGRPLYGFKIGGRPHYLQRPRSLFCACGTKLVFLAQVGEDFPFRKYKAADADNGEYPRSLDDGLLLGNKVYIMACPDRCDPAAAWPECQN
ncbi:hypothetical protein [Nocardia sp. NPDC056000]|uniref:hypothetical protein n=1 Tax=Nocardia sp. NPDC056000 TaxID=3345674 RepID=UPI0035D62761